MDADIHMIQNEKIDEISKVINEDFERLLELQTTNEEVCALMPLNGFTSLCSKMRSRLFLEIKGIHNIIKQIMFQIRK